MPETISFGTWLRQKRRSLDLTQKALADQVGCAEITVRRMEADAYKPSKELAFLLFEKLGVPEPERLQWVRFARGLAEHPKYQTHPAPPRESKTNLPNPLTSFLGREKEQVEIANLIAKNRLVTLAGVGGIGKTRLAQHVGEKLLKDYPDGVWFAAFDSLSDPTLVPSTVAAIFDIREGPDLPAIDMLKNVLHLTTLLLILDNCEHLLDSCAQLIKTLLSNCPNLRILATSREILNMEGEATYYLSPLRLPQESTLEKFGECDAVRLFTERAISVLSTFRLTWENTQPIVDICRRLDGIPLAIELAAAHIDILQAEEIREQLDACFDLLAGNRRAAVSRHQTMRASLDWSWGLLNAAEQAFMRQISAFAGGWTLEASQAVCEGDSLTLISALVRKSLVVVKQETGRRTRYGFHEIVRQYAREKLIESGEEELIRARHLEYFLQLSNQIEDGLHGPQYAEWFDCTLDERDNLRAALEYAAKTSTEDGLYLSGRLKESWENFDMQEGMHWLSKFLEKPESKNYAHARAKALWTQAWLLNWFFQFSQAESVARECLALFRACKDPEAEIDALLFLGILMDNLSKPSEALEFYQEAVAKSKSSGDKWRYARSLFGLGMHYTDDQRFAYWEQAIPLYRRAGDRNSLATILGHLGHFRLLNGDFELAERYLDEAEVTLSWRFDKWSDTWVNVTTARSLIALIQGDYEQARELLQRLITGAEETGNRMASHWALVRLGYVGLAEGNLTEAEHIFAESAQKFRKVESIIGVVFTLEGMTGLHIAQSRHEVAAHLLGWADATRKKIRDPRPRLEQANMDNAIAVCIVKMGETAFSDAYDEGQKMTLDEVIADALENS